MANLETMLKAYIRHLDGQIKQSQGLNHPVYSYEDGVQDAMLSISSDLEDLLNDYQCEQEDYNEQANADCSGYV